MAAATAEKEDVKLKSKTTEAERPPRRVLVLRLKREEEEERRRQRVSWLEGIKEHPGQKTSKKCCQFHRKRLFGESDSDDCHSGDDGYDSDYDLTPFQGGAQAAPTAAAGAAEVEEHHHHEHGGEPCSHHHPAKAHRPKCTKEACYCGTRFA